MDASLDDHSRTIIHIDIDCFYAQVEINKNPNLSSVPLGIQQKNIVVTCNYIAREYGVKKCMLISDAKKLCPNLTLVKGEDLHDYRQISYKVTELLQKYSNLVERLGLDENFIDVTNLVSEKIKNNDENKRIGNVFSETSEFCDCGCCERIAIGSVIAQEIRDKIKNELNLTTCAGIAHNKLLAKIIGSKHKPNQQTLIFPNSAYELMSSLNSVQNIPWIGTALTDQLNQIHIATVSELQNANLNELKRVLGAEKAKIVYDSSFGIDKTPVKTTGRPQSIGIEDSCKAISVETEVRDKLKQLLTRLLILVHEDGRLPKTIKLTVRKFDKSRKVSNRETKQCNVNTAYFDPSNVTQLTETNENKIMATVMTLFRKMVDIKKPYHLTLLGLSFTKFVEYQKGHNALSNFLTRDIEVQSVTNIENMHEISASPEAIPSTSCIISENSDSEPEPTPKRSKFAHVLAKKRFMKDVDDCESPSKLRVAELRLSSTEKSPDNNQNVCCPPNASEEVFWELPKEMQIELWEEYKRNRDRDKEFPNRAKKAKPNSILNYMVKK